MKALKIILVIACVISLGTGLQAANATRSAVDDSGTGWVWSGCSTVEDPSFEGGTARAGGDGFYGAYTFDGTGVTVFTMLGPNFEDRGRTHRMGSISVSIDGHAEGGVSLNRPSPSYGNPAIQVSGLKPGKHVLEIRAAKGWIVVDYIALSRVTEGASNRSGAGQSNSGQDTDGVAVVCRLNAGGSELGTYISDTPFVHGGKGTASFTIPVDLSSVDHPAPEAVYLSERFGIMSYTFPQLDPRLVYLVRLHFCENFYRAPGQREFNVAINGQNVLTNFDIVAAAGGPYRANVQEFRVSPDRYGVISIGFSAGAVDLPKISGIELYCFTGQ